MKYISYLLTGLRKKPLLSRIFVFPVLRIFFRLKIQGRSEIPSKDNCILVSSFRSPLDPLILMLSCPGKTIYISPEDLRNSERVSGLSNHGRASRRYVLFPEEEPSLYGETAFNPDIFALAEKVGLPVLTVLITGSYDALPVYSRHTVKTDITVRFIRMPGKEVMKSFLENRESERHTDINVRKNRIARDARGIENIIYLCPDCGELFMLRGDASGKLQCRSCLHSWTLLWGKGLLDHQSNRILPLGYMENLACKSLSSREIKTLQIPVSIRPEPGKKSRNPGFLLPAADHLILGMKGKESSAFVIPNNDIQSVCLLNEGLIDVTWKQKGETSQFVIEVPAYLRIFILHLLRIRAFGNPYARSGTSGRIIFE